MIKFANPQYLWLFLVFIPLIIWYIYQYKKAYPSMNMSSIMPLKNMSGTYKQYLFHVIFLIRLVIIGCIIIIIARPQVYGNWRTSKTEGLDIVLTLDVSTSMLARDFKPDRFEAAKNVANQFVSSRESDNIGLVIFAGESFTAVPMTIDRSTLSNYISNTKIGLLDDGTAIGNGIATAINRIKDGTAKSKVIILLTDGSNNSGNIEPIPAAEIAKKYGIKIYTIGIGKNGMADYPQVDYFGRITYVPQQVVIDEETLKSIATITGGKYFRATDNKVLSNIFKEIDQLEKTEMDIRHFTHTEEDFMMWAWIALSLFVIERIIRYTILRTIP